MSKGKGGGISLLEGYTVNKAVLSENERENLAVALKTMQAVKYPEIDAILEKIGAVFKNADNSDWIKIDFAGWGSSPKIQEQFADIKNAILRNHVINFDYINANGEKSNRSVEPEQLYFNKHTWYLLAFCRNRNEHRIFRMSRIKNVTVTNEKFKKRDISDEENAEIQSYSKPIMELHLRFHEGTSNNRLFRENSIKKQPTEAENGVVFRIHRSIPNILHGN